MIICKKMQKYNNSIEMLTKSLKIGPLVQQEEHSAHNRVVPGSSPGRSIKIISLICKYVLIYGTPYGIIYL